MHPVPWPLDSGTIELSSHPKARDKSIAKRLILEGSCILSSPEFASILLESEKARRCDNCFRLPHQNECLKSCTGCRSYWYCGTQCQSIQWRTHHRQICKKINSHASSLEYQALPDHQKQDSILLSHTIARLSLLPIPYSFDDFSPAAVLLSLLPLSGDSIAVPVVCLVKPSPPALLLGRLYARFGNNNFAIHSHLRTIGHGIFPIASRFFNHSCLPNAAAKYIISPTQSILMEVVALRDIHPGEEICLPYLDPALLQQRQQILELSYGFKCDCPSCSFLIRIGRLPDPPTEPSEILRLASRLREFVGIDEIMGLKLPNAPIETTPPALYCVLWESYMGSLSETFSQASHDGQYNLALESGLTLLALYVLVYPVNFPQVGMHLLELAKTAWNSGISLVNSSEVQNDIRRKQVSVFLTLAAQVLAVFGGEGDDDGPLQEIAILKTLLAK